MLKRFYFNKVNLMNTPIKKSVLLIQYKEREVLLLEKKKYQEITESIIFSIVETRPDITFTISFISCFVKNLSH